MDHFVRTYADETSKLHHIQQEHQIAVASACCTGSAKHPAEKHTAGGGKGEGQGVVVAAERMDAGALLLVDTVDSQIVSTPDDSAFPAIVSGNEDLHEDEVCAEGTTVVSSPVTSSTIPSSSDLTCGSDILLSRADLTQDLFAEKMCENYEPQHEEHCQQIVESAHCRVSKHPSAGKNMPMQPPEVCANEEKESEFENKGGDTCEKELGLETPGGDTCGQPVPLEPEIKAVIYNSAMPSPIASSMEDIETCSKQEKTVGLVSKKNDKQKVVRLVYKVTTSGQTSAGHIGLKMFCAFACWLLCSLLLLNQGVAGKPEPQRIKMRLTFIVHVDSSSSLC